MESAKIQTPPNPDVLATILNGLFDSSDASIAKLFYRLHPDNYRYIRDLHVWMQWDGQAWFPDVSHQELINCLDRLRESIRGNQSRAKSAIIESIVNRLSKVRTRSDIITAISQLPEISTLASDWDAFPHLVAFENCVYNTDTAQLISKPATIRELYLTRRISCKYNKDAKCPQWLNFLQDIFCKDDALIEFVRKLAGLSLSGNVNEELLIFAHGSGANGKTTFMNVLSQIFHDYAVEIDPRILLKGRNNDHRLLLENAANLRGKRLATANEIPELSAYDDTVVKQLSSRDPVPYKQIYQSAGSFTPSHLLWVRANHKPRFNVNDGGMLRRLILIPFAHHFPPDAQIKRYEDTLLGEASGILNWLISGWQEYHKHGLGKYPDSVDAALEEYRSECDTLAQFMNETYLKIEGARQPLKNVVNKYNEWAAQNVYRKSNSRALAQLLRQYGWEVVTGHGNLRYVNDIGLMSEEEEPT